MEEFNECENFQNVSNECQMCDCSVISVVFLVHFFLLQSLHSQENVNVNGEEDVHVEPVGE